MSRQNDNGQNEGRNEEMDLWCDRVLGEVFDEIRSLWFPYDYRKADYGKIGDISSKPVTVADVAEAVERMSLSDGGRVPQEWVEAFWEKLGNSRYARDGIRTYGCRVFYRPGSKKMVAQDVHMAEARVVDERNRPVAYLRICGEPGEYRLPAEELDDFLYEKEIPAWALRFDRDSVDRFYAFYGGENGRRRCFVRQTKAVRDARRRSGSPRIDRMDINVIGHENDFGLTFAVWVRQLVDSRMCLSEYGLGEDYGLVLDGYEPGSRAAKEVARIHRAMEDEDFARKAAERFASLQGRMQAVVDAHADGIFDRMLERMGLDPAMKDRPGFKEALNRASQRYGFDCGWVHFAFKDEELSDIAKTASMADDAHNVYRDGEFSLKLPYMTQSVTVQGYQAAEAVRLIREELGIGLFKTTRLD